MSIRLDRYDDANRSIYRCHTRWSVLEASVHPVILLGKFDDLFLKERIHAARVGHIASRWEVRERLENRQLIPLIVREHLSHERNYPRAPQSRETRNGRKRAGGNAKERDKNRVVDALVHICREHDG